MVTLKSSHDNVTALVPGKRAAGADFGEIKC